MKSRAIAFHTVRSVALRAAATVAGWVALCAAASPASAGQELLGGFHPVASEDGARAVWVNPAAVGIGPASLFEFVWFREREGEPVASAPEGFRFYSIAAATDRSALAFQWEMDDADGVADWTLAWAQPARLSGGLRIGSTLEWRAGQDDKIDGTIGISKPLPSGLTIATVVRNLFEADVDGASVRRVWQPGIAYRNPAIFGRLSWDAVIPEEETGDTEHWFGAAIERTKKLNLSYTANLDGDWSGAIHAVSGAVLFGVGMQDVEGSPRRVFFSMEWKEGPVRRDKRGGRRR